MVAGKANRMMHLGFVMNNYGHHLGAWRLPETEADKGFDFARYAEMAKTAERGLFDFLFVADSLAIPASKPENLGTSAFVSLLEPMTMMAALSSLTKNIGLVGTLTTSYIPPYLIARVLASLDIISGGRASWNLVTSGNPREADSFGYESHGSAEDRYRKARESGRIVKALWDSFTDDAFVYDKEKSQFFDPARMRQLVHEGEFFKLKGPMNLPRTPSGQILITQAGQSKDGIDLASELADIVFSMQPNLADAQKFYQAIKAGAARNGRNPDEVFVMPGVAIFVGRTDEEAREKLQRADDHFDIRVGLEALRNAFGLDMSVYPLDEPIPDDLPEGETGMGPSLRKRMIEWGKRDNLTLRQVAVKTAAHGHWQIAGSPKSIADAFEEYFTQGAADGFNLLPGILPSGLNDFVDLVVPELQKRGLFRTRYEGTTMRDNFGLARPALS